MCFLFFSYFFMGSQKGIHAWISMLALLWTTQVIPNMQFIPLLETMNIPLAPFTRSSPSQLLEILDMVKIIRLFRKRLSEKVHATILKGIVGGFVCPVLQRILKNGTRAHGHMFARVTGQVTRKSSRPKSYRPEPESCCPKYIVMSPEMEINKSRFDYFRATVVRKCIDHIPYYLSGLSRAHFFRQPFSK